MCVAYLEEVGTVLLATCPRTTVPDGATAPAIKITSLYCKQGHFLQISRYSQHCDA